MKAEPLIVVKNVQASSEFYQKILLCESGHGGDEYEVLMSDGQSNIATSCTGCS